MSLLGLKLAVKYSLPPNRLGLCGPRDDPRRKVLYQFVTGEDSLAPQVQTVLEKFEAMYPYLCLIAKSNGISDPFNEQVVKAFWVGNKLLDNVKVKDLRQVITTDFAKPSLLSKEEAERRAAQVSEGMVPHHSFHVFVLGSITGRVKFTNALRDLCRIGWGKVVGMRHEAGGMRQELRVRYKPLVLEGKIRLGEEVEREIGWERALVPEIKEGDWVSFHWGRVCDRLSEDDISNLERYTSRTLSLFQ